MMSRINLLDFFRHFKDEPHQIAAVRQLAEAMPDSLLKPKAQWVETFRAAELKTGIEPNPYQALAPLLDVIRAGEGNYESVNRGRAGDTPGGWRGLTAMRLRDILDAQRQRKVFAVGAYQFIPDTLPLAMDAAGIQPDDVFTEEVQDWMATGLILGGKRPKLRDYLIGKVDDINAAQDDLAYEWASIPNSKGRGWYDGDGAGNRANAEIAAVRKALKLCRARLHGRTLADLRTPPRPARPEPQFYSQRDNGPQADRTCFSAACAMLLKQVKPGALTGSNADMGYLQVVNKYGDTTDPAAQIKALKEYGVTARLVTNGTMSLIEEQVDRWGGIALGYIHRGRVDELDSSCSGHWLFCYDIDATHLQVHDPFGETDLVYGGFVPGKSGRACRYSRRNFGRRWEVRPQWTYAPGHGWAVVVDGVE